MRSITRDSRTRRGATIALVAVSLAATLAVGALAVDTGMLFKVRADAHRAADAAALAGASAYLATSQLNAPPIARDRALEYAARNYMGGRYIDTSGQSASQSGNVWTWETNEARVDVIPDIYRVRVTIHRASTGTIFASLLGMNSAAISVYAAAEAIDAGGANCVMPFGLSDTWSEATQAQDVNGDQVQDPEEAWSYDPDQNDYYKPFDPNVVDPTQTGYGSSYRDGSGLIADKGRLIVLKPQTGNSQRNGNFYNLWNFEEDNGARPIKDRIEGCDERTVNIGDSTAYTKRPGGTTRIKNSLQRRINRDREAYWDASTSTVQGSNQADWQNSDRIVKIALYTPDQIDGLGGGGGQPIVFNNIALFFLEPSEGNDDITGRFLYYASGVPGGGITGPLVKRIRLVE